MHVDSSRHPGPPSSRGARPSSSETRLFVEIAARTDTGQERSQNEDSFLVASPAGAAQNLPCSQRIDVARAGWLALAVCDGMGGAAAGEVASRHAVEVIHEVLAAGEPPASRSELGQRLVESLEEASRRVHAAGRAQRSLAGMGTTATACALRDDTLFVAQVGDSRAYLYREGSLTQLTRDQTLLTQLLERGQIRPEDAASFPYSHVILQAIGSERVDVELVRVTVRRGDVLLICSDGLSGPVDDEVIRAVLGRERSPATACEALIDLANLAGGPDNITCIVARITGDAWVDAPSSDRSWTEFEDPDPTPPASFDDLEVDSRAREALRRFATVFKP